MTGAERYARGNETLLATWEEHARGAAGSAAVRSSRASLRSGPDPLGFAPPVTA
jgi:hypothetical protein